MPAKKKKSTTKKKTVKTRKKSPAKKINSKKNISKSAYSFFIFAIGALFLLFAFIGKVNQENPSGADIIHSFLLGIFGVSIYLIAPLLLILAVIISKSNTGILPKIRVVQVFFLTLILTSAVQIIFFGSPNGENITSSFKNLYENGKLLKSGGTLSGIFSFPLLIFGRIAACFIILLILFITVSLITGKALHESLRFLILPFTKLFQKIKDGFFYVDYEDYDEDEDDYDDEDEDEYEDEDECEEDFYDYEVEEPVPNTNPAKKSKPIYTSPETNNKIYDHKKEVQEYTAIEKISESLPYDQNTQEDSDIVKNNNSESLFEVLEDYRKENTSIDSMDSSALKESTVPDLIYNNREKENKPLDSFQSQEENSFNSQLEIIQVPEVRKPKKQVNKGEFRHLYPEYSEPPTLLLNEPENKNHNDTELIMKKNAEKLISTLKSFGVSVSLSGICRGPSVTRYEIQPAAGVQIAKITRLQDDIALNFAAAGVRIEAPIPGKSAVGIEVPNETCDIVPFKGLVESSIFKETKSKLGAAIGMDITGNVIIADIAKMPHILIAGTTGSGKSVCVNSIIMSILFRSSPVDVRFLMIDPKAVEFMIYAGIPHLLIPVVTDPKKASGALSWAVTEMLKRYKLFSAAGVRDLTSYNAVIKNHPDKHPDAEPLPQIVIFIDELADLMMASPGEVEDAICRLAQMARAAGMHLVIATQRPSVNVVTGVIKANIPSRIALKVASQVDSRTIIDSAGAEKLLGKGDMLYFPVGTPKPLRVQGCWVSDSEVDRVVEFIKQSFVLSYDDDIMKEVERQTELNESSKKGSKNKRSTATDSEPIDLSDEKLIEAIDAVIEAGQASTSYLQRKLKLGYGRAARIIDIMEQMGVVGEAKGSKPREVIMSHSEWLSLKDDLHTV